MPEPLKTKIKVEADAWALMPPELQGDTGKIRDDGMRTVEVDVDLLAKMAAWLDENLERVVPGRATGGGFATLHPQRWGLFDAKEKVNQALGRLTKAAAQAAREPGVLDEVERETLRKVLKGTITGMTQRKLDNAAKTLGVPSPKADRYGRIDDPEFRKVAAKALGVELPEVQAERDAWEEQHGFRVPKVDPKQWDKRTCAACWHAHAMLPRGGGLTHHGYERPGWGHIVGDCIGVRESPWEVASYVAVRTLKGWEERAVGLREIVDGKVKITRAPAKATNEEIHRTNEYFKVRVIDPAVSGMRYRPTPVQVWWDSEDTAWRADLYAGHYVPSPEHVFVSIAPDGTITHGPAYDATFLNDKVNMYGQVLVGAPDPRWPEALKRAMADVRRELHYLWKPGFGGIPWLRAAIRRWEPSETGPVGAPLLKYPEDYTDSDFEGKYDPRGDFLTWLASDAAAETLGAEVEKARLITATYTDELREVLD